MEAFNSQGLVILVDPQDLDLVSTGEFFLGKRGYPVVRGSTSPQDLHRLIAARFLTLNPSHEVDHRNRDKLDNRRSNLRATTISQNRANRGLQKNNRVGFKGVYRKPNDKFEVQIQVASKKICLGTYLDPIEAAKAYDRAALAHFGAFAVLNFPS